MSDIRRRKVVIVGCGFAGSAAVRELARANERTLEVIAFDKQPCRYNYPVLPRLLNEDIPNERIEVPLRTLFKGLPVDLRQERVETVDAGNRTVGTQSGATAYDYLVLALGSRAVPIAQDDGLFVFYPKSSRHLARLSGLIRNQAKRAAEVAASHQASSHSIAVIGGGLTGVEFALGIREAANRACNRAGSDCDSFDVRLYERATRLHTLGPVALSRTLQRELTALNVRVLLERQILRVAHNGLITPTGLEPADTVVCCTGSDPNFRVDLRGLSVQPGGIAVDSTLRSEEHDRVFVIGDGMLFREFGEARRDLHQAHRAVVQGRLAACNILRLLRAKPLQVYDPGSTPIGVMLQAKRGVFCYRERCINGRLAGYIKRWLELRPT